MMDQKKLIAFAGGTDRGRVRKQNEDNILMSEFDHSDVILLQVADGVGGHEGGEVASKLAVETIQAEVSKAVLQANSGGGYGADWLELTLSHAVACANELIVKKQKEIINLNEMATTIVALLIQNNQVVVCYLGDSRCYRYTNDSIIQLTEDHTMLQKLLNEGKITQHEFEVMPMHHMISQALGLTDKPEIKVTRLESNSKSNYLLCSDGLTNCISDEQIQHILCNSVSLENSVDELITEANDNGGIDNISVVLVEGFHR